MLVVGLHGWILPPGAILVCDIFVYSEFLIHPLLLLGASGKMRREVLRGVKTNVTVRWSPFIWITSGGPGILLQKAFWLRLNGKYFYGLIV